MNARNYFLALTMTAALSSSAPAFAQSASAKPTTPIAASAPTAVPSLIPYAGVATASDGKSLTGETAITFQIFKDEQGGEALFTETQTVALDSAGHYKLQLGATLANGIPIDLFSSGEARWLEVQVAGENPQTRILLASVPYALKAGDATTLGGLPVSAFALAGAESAPVAALAAAQNTVPHSNSTITTTGGTSGYLPIFTGTSTVADSIVFQNTLGIGIGDVPNAALDVNGKAIFRGAFQVARIGNATESAGVNSNPFSFFAQAYDSAKGEAVGPSFSLQSEATGNDTASPGATLNLLYNTGLEASSSETGFHFNPNGTINFAAGQTFPATSSTGVAVDGASTSGIGVEGSSSSGAGVEGISNSNNGVTGLTGNTANTAGVYGVAGSASGIGSGTIAGVWGDAHSHVGVVGTSALFPGVAGESTSGDGVLGTSTSSNGVAGTTGNTANTAGVYGIAGSASGIGSGTIAGVWGDAHSHVGVTGTSALFPGVAGESTSGDGVEGTSAGTTNHTAGVYGLVGTPSGFTGGLISGVWGDSANHTAITGTSVSFPGVQGVSTDSYGLQGVSTYGAGIYGSTVSSSNSPGIYGVYSAPSTEGRNFGGQAGIWADTSSTEAGAALLATTDNNFAAHFASNSEDSVTVLIENDTTSNSAFVLAAEGNGGSCFIDVNGNLSCNGSITDVVKVDNGARNVETYSVQSAENWFEDAGSGQLKGGTAHIDLEPVFGQTVNTGVEYHVFLTPDGDCKGLYVSAKSSGGFDVRELGGGKSTIAFEYRIMAKRTGYETARLTDVTARTRQQSIQREKMRRPAAAPTAKKTLSANVAELK